MNCCMASCGVSVPELDEVEEVLEAEAASVAAAEEEVVVPPVAAVAAELAVVTAPEAVSACINAASRPPAGGADAALWLAPEEPTLAALPEAWVELPSRPTAYCW